MSKTKNTITVGEIEAVTLIFAYGDTRYVVRAEPMDYSEFRRHYAGDDKDGLHWQQATGLNMNESWSTRTATGFYGIAVADCYDPPVAIVRASGPEEAVDVFADELPWAHISDVDLEDYREPIDELAENVAKQNGETDGPEDYADNVSFNSNGVAYDNENIHVWEVRLIRIEME